MIIAIHVRSFAWFLLKINSFWSLNTLVTSLVFIEVIFWLLKTIKEQFKILLVDWDSLSVSLSLSLSLSLSHYPRLSHEDTFAFIGLSACNMKVRKHYTSGWWEETMQIPHRSYIQHPWLIVISPKWVIRFNSLKGVCSRWQIWCGIVNQNRNNSNAAHRSNSVFNF